ncbi:maltose/moltooligosaccharide transporter [Mucilaginibacter sp. SG538B]|uniref:MFS transporter n=1 Tax=Mucilaginibacter sp. SG538B TaxID=2587021 RepID=UPI00159DD764|nr:MFS transporter [Mucilaginibacter sp. SG538B]NVM62411.1 maltose/moltooligosaccharide transporter [Mucilaginibacter sp. SG538B]
MSKPTIAQKPRLSFWQIFNMSFGFLGIQFGFALQTGNASRILQTFGADVEHLSWFWLAAPITGMVVQPIIGHYSDRTWNRLGRRRPYFLTGAILSGLALFFMPNSSMLAALIPPIVVGAGMLMIMDASFNVAMEPFRALVADNLPDSQHTTGFSMQTCLIGVGAVIGSWLPYVFAEWFGIAKTADQGIVPNNVLYSFYIGAAVLIGAILWTVVRTKEYPPEVYATFHEKDEMLSGHKGGLLEIFSDLVNMPKTMKQLGLVQFFSWFALFSMWVFTTPAVVDHVYHISAGDTSSAAYNDAANWVNVLFGVYNLVSAVYALLLPRIVKKLSRKKAHAFSLTMGGLGLISVFFIPDPRLLILSMIGVGLAWGSILAMPYAILSSSIPAKKIGVYMGIFNFFITFPQIVNGIIGGPIVKYTYSGHAIYALVMAGIFMFLGAIAVLFVQDGKKIQIIEAAN